MSSREMVGKAGAFVGAEKDWLMEGENFGLTVSARCVVEVTGREGVETARHAVRVGLRGLDGGGGSDESSDSVGELHCE